MGAGWLLTLALAASCAREATPVPTAGAPGKSSSGGYHPSQLGAPTQADDVLLATLRNTNYIQVPGPNPLLRAGAEGAKWPGAGRMMEFGDIFRDFDTCAPGARSPAPR